MTGGDAPGLRDQRDQGVVDRPLPVRRRPDLEVIRWPTVRNRAWVIKDPVAGSFVQLGDEEAAVLEMLDGRQTLETIRRSMEQRFFPAQFPVGQLYRFLGQLHEHGLLLTDASGQAGPLWQRRQRRQRRKWVGRLVNCLAIRLPGWNPAGVLTALYPRLSWLFSGPMLGFWLLFCTLTIVWFSLNVSEAVGRLPPPSELVSAANLGSLLAAWSLAKLVHESAHALTCHHYGGQCREVGMIFLVFTPCFYCDVSDAWLFPGKWQRIAVSAAGIVAELVLAAGAAWVWWFSVPGWLNAFCLNLMILGSVNTLAFNGNPLLRFDGYYILADLLDMPDLDRRAGLLARSFFAERVFGMRLYHPRLLPQHHRGLLLIYWTAATTYRLILMVAVLLAFGQFVAWQGYPWTARLLTLWAGLFVTVAVLWRLASFLFGLLRSAQERWPALILRCLVLGLPGLVLLWLPLPGSLTVPAVLEPADAGNVFVPIPGLLRTTTPAGTAVVQGQLLGRLENPGLQQRLTALRGQRNRQRIQVMNLQRRRSRDPLAATELATAQVVLEDLEQRLQDQQRELDQLELRAPRSGFVLPPPVRPETDGSYNELPDWSGTPLEKRNLGCFLETATLFCRVAGPGELEVILLLSAADLERVATGQLVTVRQGAWSAKTVRGTIEEIDRVGLEERHDSWAAGPPRDPSQAPKHGRFPAPQRYRARVSLEGTCEDLFSGGTAVAVVSTPASPLVYRAANFFNRTFRAQH